jgi:predicted permease
MPDWKSEIRRRLQNSQLAPAREAAIVEELAQYLDDYYAELLTDGKTEAEAYRQTLTELHGSELLAHELRWAERQVSQEPIVLGTNRRTNMIADLGQDLRFGARMLLKQPGFTLIAALTLALGIGANTAIFSVVNAALLRPLPYARPERIVAIWDGRGQPGATQGATLPRNFQLWREQSRSFSDLALARSLNYRLAEAQEATTGVGQEVTPNLFAMLGASALHGRPLAAGDENAGVRLVVLSYKLWRGSFGGDESVVGRTIRLNGGAVTVVGIMPPEFVFPPRVSLAPEGAAQDCDLWTPMALDQRRLQTSVKNYLAFGRLREGVTLAQAQSEMNTFAPRLTEADPALNEQLSIHLAALPELTTREARPALAVLLGVVAFILLIACANVANLLLARAVARSREVAIRTALGATRGRMLRQILTECALLGLLGSLTGLALAYGGLKLLTSVAALQSPHPVKIDPPVLGFTLALSLLATLLVGAGTAWQMARGAVGESLQEAGRGGAGGVRLSRARSGLAVAQIALSLILLLGAGLLVRTLWKLLRVDPGFRAAGVLTMDVRLPGSKYPRTGGAGVAAAYAELLERLGRLPGVVSTGATQLLPIRRDPVSDSFQIEGRPMRFPGDLLPAEYRVVTPGYFTAMRIPLLEGRFLSDSDTETSQPVVVISERLARLYFPQGSPLGRRITFSDPQTGPWHVIVGVVRDIRNWGLAADPTPETYVSIRQNPKPLMTLVIRTEGDPLGLAPSVRAELRAFDKELVPEHIATMEQILSRSLAQRRLNLALIGSLAVLAVALAAGGLYSLITYTVAQRTHEIGIRLALGAQRRDILRLALRQGFTLAALGIALGLAGGIAATRALRSLLFGVSPTDPVTFASIPLLLALVALLACWFPARRAMKVDPLVALRCE